MSNDLRKSDAFALLANRRRRLLLRLLRDSDTRLTVTELAERIRERECDDSPSRDPTSIRLRLHHGHLPKLEEADVVAYDETERTVRPDRHFETLVYLLEKAENDELVRSER